MKKNNVLNCQRPVNRYVHMQASRAVLLNFNSWLSFQKERKQKTKTKVKNKPVRAQQARIHGGSEGKTPRERGA